MEYQGTDRDDNIDFTRLGLPDWSTVYARAGNDIITFGNTNAAGEAGNDTLIATSPWANAVYWSSPKSVVVDLAAGTAQDGFGTTDTLVGIHSVHGSPQADTLLGSQLNDMFYGGRGDDVIDGRDGKDTVSFFFTPSTKFSITYNEANQTVTVRNDDPNNGNYGTKTLKNIEQIQFTGDGSDGISILVNALRPNGFRFKSGTSVPNADAGANPRWAVTDLNGDGLRDLVLRFDPESSFSTTTTGSSPVRFLIRQHDGSFAVADLAMSGNVAPTLVNKILAADFNRDGKGDVIIGASGQDPYLDGKPYGPWPGEQSYVLMSGTQNHASLPIAGMPVLFGHHVSVGDINGDGASDIFVASISSEPAKASYFLINNGHGGFDVNRTRLPASILDPTHKVIERFSDGSQKKVNQSMYTSSALFDANGDGALDLAILPAGGTDVGQVFLNDGAGNFSDTRKILLPAGPYGAGAITWSAPSSNDVHFVGSTYLDTVAMDVNGDGRQDLISIVTKDRRDGTVYEYYRGAAVQILINDGKVFVDESVQRTDFRHQPASNFSHYDTIEAVDINADGFRDIVLYRAQTQSVDDAATSTRILLNNGSGVFLEQPYPVGLPDGQFVAINASRGEYAVIQSGIMGTDPATGFGRYMFKVDAATFDWSSGRDFFTDAQLPDQAVRTADMPGRWIHDSNTANTILLSSGDEHAYGYGGNDIIQGGAGHDVIDGGAGLDISVYAGNASSYRIARTATGHAISGADSDDALAGIERLRFADKMVAIDIDGNAGQAYRLYQAAFDRKPDLGGLGAQINGLDSGMSLLQISQNFINSEEFLLRYGANLSNAAFVTQLYANVLHRAPDEGGYAVQVGALNNGMSRAQLLVNFSESTENYNATIIGIQNGIEYTLFG